MSRSIASACEFVSPLVVALLQLPRPPPLTATHGRAAARSRAPPSAACERRQGREQVYSAARPRAPLPPLSARSSWLVLAKARGGCRQREAGRLRQRATTTAETDTGSPVPCALDTESVSSMGAHTPSTHSPPGLQPRTACRRRVRVRLSSSQSRGCLSVVYSVTKMVDL